MKPYYKIIILVILIIVINIILLSFPVIPKMGNQDDYKMSLNEIHAIYKKLQKSCNSSDARRLSMHYQLYFKDKNTSLCWSQFAELCHERKQGNKSLKIPTKCKIY